MKTIQSITEQLNNNNGQDEALGAFRVKEIKRKTGRNGKPYFAMRLEDATGSMPAIARIHNSYLTKDALVSNKRMLCQLRLREHQGEVWAEMLSATQWVPGLSHPIGLLPYSQCPIPDALKTLLTFRDNLAGRYLQQFVDTVLLNDGVSIPFISAPASLNHHHAMPGGLLIHSLEVAEIVNRLGADQQDLLELAQVAALFHDIGKIKTMNATMKRTQLGFVVDHNALTLEILAPALSQLEKHWPDGATTLRYLLTWHHHPKPGTPLMVMAEVLRAADRISTGQDIQNKAYSNALPWQQGAKIESLPYPQRFWRPRHPVQMAVRP